MYNELTLECAACGRMFSFEAEEQAFYHQHGYAQPPRRCRECRMTEKAIRESVKPKRITYTATCARCGHETQIPFNPTGDKPVYCMTCFVLEKKSSAQ